MNASQFLHSHNAFLRRLEANQRLYVQKEEGNFSYTHRSSFSTFFKDRPTLDKELGEKYAHFLERFEIGKKTLHCSNIECIEKCVSLITHRLRKRGLSPLAFKIHRLFLALQYRMKSNTSIYEKKPPSFEKNKEWLLEALTEWKKKQFPKPSLNISPLEERNINITCYYEDFVNLLKKDPSFFDSFAKFAFRDLLGRTPYAVDIAIQFPTLFNLLQKSYIDKRLRRIQGDRGLHLTEEQKGVRVRKKVHLLINSKLRRINYLEKKVTFSDGTTFSLQEIFSSFAKKHDETGEFEYLQHKGIVHSLPKTPSFDASRERWYEELPVLENLSYKALQERYKFKEDLEEGEGLIVIRASRQHPRGLRVDGTHAWLQIVRPKKNGTYDLLSFGKYAAYNAPSRKGLQAIYEGFRHTFLSQEGILTGPDDNEFYLFRQQKSIALKASKEVLNRLFCKLKKDLTDVQDHNFVFQTQGQNCAEWVDKTCRYAFRKKHQHFPHLFRVPLLDTNNSPKLDFVNRAFKVLKDTLPAKLFRLIAYLFTLICGGGTVFTVRKKGIQRKETLCNFHLRQKELLSLPSKIFTYDVEKTLLRAHIPVLSCTEVL